MAVPVLLVKAESDVAANIISPTSFTSLLPANWITFLPIHSQTPVRNRASPTGNMNRTIMVVSLENPVRTSLTGRTPDTARLDQTMSGVMPRETSSVTNKTRAPARIVSVITTPDMASWSPLVGLPVQYCPDKPHEDGAAFGTSGAALRVRHISWPAGDYPVLAH